MEWGVNLRVRDPEVRAAIVRVPYSFHILQRELRHVDLLDKILYLSEHHVK